MTVLTHRGAGLVVDLAMGDDADRVMLTEGVGQERRPDQEGRGESLEGHLFLHNEKYKEAFSTSGARPG